MKSTCAAWASHGVVRSQNPVDPENSADGAIMAPAATYCSSSAPMPAPADVSMRTRGLRQDACSWPVFRCPRSPHHQYLIAARPAYYPNADKGPAAAKIAVIDGDPRGIGLRQRPTSPRSALDGPVEFLPSQLPPDFYALNTMGPPFWPAFSRDAQRLNFADLSDSRAVPPQSHLTIGELLNRKALNGLGMREAGNAR